MFNALILFFIIYSLFSTGNSENVVEFSRSACRNVSGISVNPLVVKGRISAQGAWPWIAALSDRTSGFFCGGSLVSERFVVTAAHCLHPKGDELTDTESFEILLGKWNLSDKAEPNALNVAPDQIKIHPDWNTTQNTRFDADLAMIRLAHDITFTPHIRPVCMWSSDTRPEDETNVGGTVVGWGTTEGQSLGQHSDVPREVQLKGHDIYFCYENGLHEIASKQGLCIGGNGTGAGPCNGDSGGGFFSFQGGIWFLRGITSASRLNDKNTCDVNFPTAFTNVGIFFPWIDRILDGGEQLICEFKLRHYYSCKMQSSIDRRNMKFMELGQKHAEGRANEDVQEVTVAGNSRMKFLPVKLGEDFFPNLLVYWIFNSGLEEISRLNFVDLVKLEELHIERCHLKAVQKETFDDLVNLRSLWLPENQIKSINALTFIKNTELRSISLANNNIKSLDSSTFSNNLNLQSIRFKNNLLTTIGSKLTKPLADLLYADFTNNTCINAGYSGGSENVENSVSLQALNGIFEIKC